MASGVRQVPVTCFVCQDKSCATAILQKEELTLVETGRHEAIFPKGETIIHEGSMTSHILYLKSGLVKEFIKGSQEKEQITQIVRAHSYLGLSSLFGDRVNNFSYAALEEIRVCYIDVSVFQHLVKKNGLFAYEILISMARDNLNNFNRFMKQSQKKTYGRVADAILYFSTIIYESDSFTLPFTRQEFADLIGISRESATRVLRKFHDDGILTLTDRQVRINNLPLLQQIGKNG